MNKELQVLQVEKDFFAALLEGSADVLDGLLSDDFTIIDVMRGGEVAKAALLDAIRSGLVKFVKILPLESKVRLYGPTAVVTGRTQMTIQSGSDTVTVASRYTHVFVEQSGRWRLAAAQGTRIAD